MIAPYIDAGMTHVLVANYGQLVTTGDFSDAVANVNLLAETMQSLRDYVVRASQYELPGNVDRSVEDEGQTSWSRHPASGGELWCRSATRTQSRP